MKAVGSIHPLPISDPASLQDFELPKPDPHKRDLLVRVEAISVNPVDTKIRRSPVSSDQEGTHRVLGWDVAGVIEAVGEQVTLFQVGDEVYYSGSLVRPGANSEYHLVDERLVAKKPAIFHHDPSCCFATHGDNMPMKLCLIGWQLQFEMIQT